LHFRKIAWFSIDDLPSALGQDEQCKAFGPNFRSRDFFHVLSFVEDLRKYVKKRRSQAKRVAEKTPKIQILQRMLERVISKCWAVPDVSFMTADSMWFQLDWTGVSPSASSL